MIPFQFVLQPAHVNAVFIPHYTIPIETVPGDKPGIITGRLPEERINLVARWSGQKHIRDKATIALYPSFLKYRIDQLARTSDKWNTLRHLIGTRSLTNDHQTTEISGGLLWRDTWNIPVYGHCTMPHSLYFCVSR